MKKLSFWAKQNPRNARLIIIGARVLSGFLAAFMGLCLALEGYLVAQTLYTVSAGLLVSAYFLYPRDKSLYYIRRKVCEGLVFVSVTLFYMGLGNMRLLSSGAFAQVPVRHTTTLLADAQRGPSGEKEIAVGMKHWRHKIIRMSQKMEDAVKEGKEKLPPGLVVSLVLLSLVILAGLGYLVAALACSLSCNGQEAWAVVLLIGGLAAIIFLIYVLWRAAIRRHRRRRGIKM